MATITAKLLVARPYKKDTLPAGADPKHASSCLLAHRALTSQNAVTHELELRRIPLPRTPVNGPSASVLGFRRSHHVFAICLDHE
jgi:hypothetical protein